MLLAPTLFLLLVEVILRLSGYGDPTSFFLPVAGQDNIVTGNSRLAASLQQEFQQQAVSSGFLALANTTYIRFVDFSNHIHFLSFSKLNNATQSDSLALAGMNDNDSSINR